MKTNLPLTRRRLLISGIVVISMVVMLPVLITSFQKSRTLAQRNSCVANMRQIDGAVHALSLENKLKDGDFVPHNWVAGVLKGNMIPICPGGGSYYIPPVGGHPTCSFHGDLFRELGYVKDPLPRTNTSSHSKTNL
jgi:hypothetical protein